VRPFLAKELDIDWGAAYLCLFPDGNMMHGSWTSYAIVALAIAIVYELSMQILSLLMRVSNAILAGPVSWPGPLYKLYAPLYNLAAADIRKMGICAPSWIFFQVSAFHGSAFFDHTLCDVRFCLTLAPWPCIPGQGNVVL
jgi:hypothetical protein